MPADGRIRFQKPTKRDADDTTAGKSSTKRQKQDTKPVDNEKEQPKQSKQNKQLLSFADDEEEED